MRTIEAAFDTILVKPIVREKCASGWNAYLNGGEVNTEGYVVSVGSGGTGGVTPYSAGDHVVYAPHAGTKIPYDGDVLLSLNPSEVLARIVEVKE